MHAQGGDAPDERDPNVLFGQREWWAVKALNLEQRLEQAEERLRSARWSAWNWKLLATAVADRMRHGSGLSRRPYRPSTARS